MKGHITEVFLVPVKPFATAPGSYKECDSPRLDVSMCELIHVEDSVSIICEL